MKHIRRRGAALSLAILLAVSPVAAASEAMGHDLHTGRSELSVGTTLTKQIFWSDTYSDLRTERYFTYTPNTSVNPTVAYGDTVLSRATLTSMAQSLEAQGKRVIAGTNGDYYVMATGNPVGLVITDGIVRSASPYNYAVGFREDGTAFIGKPDISVTATFHGNTLAVYGGINKVRSETGGYYLFTDDFSATTQNTSPGVDVILTPVLDNVGETVDVDLDVTNVEGDTNTNTDTGANTGSGQTENGAETETRAESGPGMEPEETSSSADLTEESLTDGSVTGEGAVTEEVKGTLVKSAKPAVGGRVSCVVEQVLESTGPISIPEGKMVLSINAKGNEWLVSQLRSLKPGETVDIDVTAGDARFAEAEEALGALYKLVTNGAVESGLDKERTARTAIGIKADGTVIFYTMDGKQTGYSVGATMTQVAMRLVELGCVEAVCLDGGGSTTAGATFPDDTTMEVINSPSDGAQRANSTAIFLTTELQPTGELSHFQLSPSDAMVLAGSTIQMSAMAVDSSYYQMSYSGPLTYSVQNGNGLVTTEGLFTASSESGSTQVAVSVAGATGTADITVVKTPDKISLTDETTGAAITALSVEPGEQINLKASSIYKKLALLSSDTAYVWTVDPAVGTVDANGVFTAGEKTASGSLTVSAGGTALVVPVNVAGHVMALETFEGSFSSLSSTAAASATAETSLDYVRYGSQSAKVTYDAAAGGTAGLVSTLSIPTGERYLSLWVYGDASGNSLTATVADQSGNPTDVLLTALDFTGWKHVTAALPDGATVIRSLQIIYGGAEGKAAGTIWLDHLTTSNEIISDTTPPTVTVTVNGTTVTAVVTDNVDRSIPKECVVLTRDGVNQTFTWNQETGTLTATLPAADSQSHRITVTAVDASGNLARGSADMAPTVARDPVFTDTDDHWAGTYADYLYDTGVTTGVSTDSGLQFQPDKNITRGEFFALVARRMNLNLDAYDSVELPFADAAEIPSWALREVKAMYALGILKGTSDGSVLKCNANATISRAEAMTILGRTQARGYAEVELTFTDAAQVPTWAAPFVRSLVGQGVVNGYNNLIQPLNPITRGEVAKMLYAML